MLLITCHRVDILVHKKQNGLFSFHMLVPPVCLSVLASGHGSCCILRPQKQCFKYTHKGANTPQWDRQTTIHKLNCCQSNHTSASLSCIKLDEALQAVPSGSGRWHIGQQVIQSQVQGSSGKALLAAALAKLGIINVPSGKVLSNN